MPEQSEWRQKITASRKQRDVVLTTWKRNVAARKNKVDAAADKDAVSVPVDWSRTKNKQAQLFFQVPKIRTKARKPQMAQAGSVYTAALNYELEHEAKAYVMMDECLADVINASGIAVAMVGFDGVFEPVEVPAIDPSAYAPEQLEQIKLQNGGQLPTKIGQRAIYTCYYTNRVSPAQFLRPADFIGSDWQKAEWLGHDGRIPLAEALRRGWVDDTYEEVCADKIETVNESNENDAENKPIGKYVKFAEIFYRQSVVKPEVKDPRKIGHLVFVDGKDEPVVDEDFKWQVYDAQSRQWIGLTTFPIKVMTLTTISDEAIPPSDTEIGSPQVKELNRSRQQMLRQRDRSLPLRWFDVNLVDEVIAEQMRQGIYQDMIPMNGPGDNAIGEVARANYPRENFEFQQIIGSDLDEAWSMGPNQQGFSTPGDTSATEVNVMQGAANVRLDYERARVLRFFLEVAEGVGALMQLFQDEEKWITFTDDAKRQGFLAWDRTKIRGDFLFEASPDAAVRVDVGQKRVESLNLYKLLRRDPLINPQSLVAEVLELHGLDPASTFAPPPQPQPQPANIRFAFKGEDLANPLTVALIQKSPTPITPAELEAAKALMGDAGIPTLPPQIMNTPEPGQDGQPPSPEQIEQAAGPENPGHPGPAPVVEPLNQRYEKDTTATAE